MLCVIVYTTFKGVEYGASNSFEKSKRKKGLVCNKFSQDNRP